VSAVEVVPGVCAASKLGGRFRLEDRVGEAYRASLWKATDELLSRPVAIHVLPEGLALRRGLIEAVNAAARVTDPRLAKIFDADYGARCPYIVSEWAPGECVEDLLKAGLFSPVQAAAIIADAADALAVAHAAGRPHSCLGPRSLRLGACGVKITGLGIEAGLSGASSDDAAMTDARALGRMLYALLTGYWPGDEATALPSAPTYRGCLCAPWQLRAGVPADLSAIACRTVQTQPCRFGPPVASPAELAAALRTPRQARRGIRNQGLRVK
jgi:serine/threonine protein kinase